MKKEKMIAVCDSDISYAGRLVEYLRQEAAFPCEIRLYTSAETLLEDPDARSVHCRGGAGGLCQSPHAQ